MQAQTPAIGKSSSQQDNSSCAATLESRSDGYVRWRSWDSSTGSERYVYVHQLLAIASGADPECVFSNGEFHVHHRNGFRYDNRPDNLELKSADEHCRLTFGGDADDR